MKLVSERNEDMKMFEEGLYCAVVEWVTKSQGKFYNVLTPIDVEGMRGEGGDYRTNSIRDKAKCIINAVRCNVFNRL